MHSDSGSDDNEGDEDGEDEESSGEEVSAESEFEDGDDEAAEQVRKKIAEALKASGMDVGEDGSDEDSDEELMDDEQMMALDGTLADIFRTRTNERKSKKGVSTFCTTCFFLILKCFEGVDAQREATHFKNRVLDLVDIFAKREPQSPLNIRLVLPLLELATKSGRDERQLSDKAGGILKSRLVKSKNVPTTAPRDEVETVLREVHRRAQRSHVSDALALLSQASLYLCRILVSSNEEAVVVEVYQESLDDYMSRKASQLAFSFFQDWARRFPLLGWKARDHVLASSSKAVNLYRKSQAFQLLQIILGQPDKVRVVYLSEDDRRLLTPPQGEDPTATVAFQATLQKTILDMITLSVDDERGLSAAQVKDLLKLVLLCIRQTRKTTASTTVHMRDPTAWKTLHDQLSSSDRFKTSLSVLKMCRQVESTTAQCKQVIGEKRKADTDEVTDTDSSPKFDRKKQKKGKSYHAV